MKLHIYILMLAIWFFVGALVSAAVIVTVDHRSEPETADCTYEDMLPYELQVDAYGHEAGDVLCLHVDIVNDAPTPEDVAKG